MIYVPLTPGKYASIKEVTGFCCPRCNKIYSTRNDASMCLINDINNAWDIKSLKWEPRQHMGKDFPVAILVEDIQTKFEASYELKDVRKES